MQSYKCAAFWNHTNIRNDNRIFPCCRFKQPIAEFNGNTEQILFHKSYQDLRKQSLSNEPIKGCEKCYYEESIGRESLRQKFNKEYETDIVSLKYLEIGFDNICNLTCDGCWEEFSSEWAVKKGIEKSIVIKSTKDITNVPDSVDKVLFLGGEPLMTTRHRKFLKMITRPENVEVIYNTNGTFLLKDQDHQLLDKFKSVKFILSIDGYGDLNDKVRSGSHWDDILKFIDQIKTSKYDLEINTVLHLNNWQGLPKLFEFIKEISVAWNINVLTYPDKLDVRRLENKESFIDLIKDLDIPNKEFIINHVRS